MQTKQAPALEYHWASSGFCFAKIAWQFAPHTRDDAVFSKDFVNAYETCRRHNCRVCDFERGL